jgi:hypothetical protein
MSKSLLQAVSLTLVFSVVAVCAMVSPGHYPAPAVPIEVSDVLFPTAGPTTVAVSLIATVDTDGRVSHTELLDSVGSTLSGDCQAAILVGYEENSISAAKRWKFSPALEVSTLKPTQSVASITFLYDRVGANPGVLPTLKTVVAKTGEYVPPVPRTLYRGEYPWNSIGIGAVVLVLQIEADGSVADVKPIRSIPSLDQPSIKAVKKWAFVPARYMGKSIRSTTIVALVYLPFMSH